MKKILIFLLSELILHAAAFGQKVPIRYGDVSMEELELKAYPADTSAAAAILCDYGYFDSHNFQFSRTLRIKIFKKEGYNLANYVMPAAFKSQVRGVTFNLENGKIVQDKLKNESIFSERVTESEYRVRVAMPSVKVGSVFDIQLTMNGIPSVWRFQDLVPVKYSELIMNWNEYIDFTKNFYGFEKLNYTSPTRWVATDMPSFKIEPYINSQENYITKFVFGLKKFLGHDFASDWETISRTLIEESDFGSSMMMSTYLNPLAKSISSSGKSKDEMIRMACDSIRHIMKWDKSESLFPTSTNLAAKFRLGSGNSSEINLILILLLRKLDIETTPVVLSTRSNGVISPVIASIQQLNYVLAMVKTGDKTLLLDATNPYLPYNILPFNCLNFEGRSVNKTKSEQIDLSPVVKDKKVTMYDLKLENDMTLSGKIQVQHSDYSAGNFREAFSKFNSQDEYLDSYKKDKPGLLVSKLEVQNLDNVYMPVTESFEVKIGTAQSNGVDEIMFQPMLYEQMKENPFRAEVRKCPVDFGYKTDYTTIISVALPEGYNITSLPASVNLRMEDGSGSYLYQVVQAGSSIKLTSKFSINKIMFLPSEYLKLREFFNQIMNKQAEPVVLKKV
jgi:hypothetical protein